MIPIDLSGRVSECNTWLKIHTVGMDYGVYVRASSDRLSRELAGPLTPTFCSSS